MGASQTKCKPACALLQNWGDELFEALEKAGGRAYSNYAVGYNNVVVPEATERGIPVGNTPGTSEQFFPWGRLWILAVGGAFPAHQNSLRRVGGWVGEGYEGGKGWGCLSVGNTLGIPS